ncbi:hypothetical protein ABER02_18210 [Rossellomorea marisflavi]|uniref:hypothetical protein n=1 Tax=Rossellomorea marisflavi TaxID=189381 RepID=UPI003D28B998
MKKSLMVFFIIGMVMMNSGCGKEDEFSANEITEMKEDPSTYYMKVQFTPKNIGKDSVLEAIQLGNAEIKDAYLIDDRGHNTPEEYKKRKISSLPIDIKSGEKYSVVLISEDKDLFEKEEIDFSYKTGSKELIYTYTR